MCGLLVLALGVLFLLRDIGVWDFWNIQWWTAAFIIGGFASIGMAGCPGCQACSCAAEPKKGKK
jgi:hypothetical protein